MRSSLLRFLAGLVAVAVAAIACRQGDPAIEPRTPPNSPVPTRIDRPDDPRTAPRAVPLVPDGGTTR